MPATRDSMASVALSAWVRPEVGEPVAGGRADHVGQHVGEQARGQGLPVALGIRAGPGGRYHGGYRAVDDGQQRQVDVEGVGDPPGPGPRPVLRRPAGDGRPCDVMVTGPGPYYAALATWTASGRTAISTITSGWPSPSRSTPSAGCGSAARCCSWTAPAAAAGVRACRSSRRVPPRCPP